MRMNIRTIGSIVSPARPHHDDESRLEFPNLTSEQRSPFETDGDKIAFSEGFRALSDKTQVHDRTGSNSGYRNRLTHSMEVARVGRSLGVAVGARMIGFYGLHAAPHGEAFWRVDPTEIGHIVAAACMAHDLGNPPFGHQGEDEISRFYREHTIGQEVCDLVTKETAQELRLHEGNAQGFRMITRTMGWREGRGLNLTSATLAAFGKYPYAFREGEKKYGVFHDDLKTMEMVAAHTGMIPDPKGGWTRHPLAYLMEAADDICYLTVDLEDATQLGLVSFEQLAELFRDVVGSEIVDQAYEMASRGHALKFLRSKMVKALINACVEIYPTIAERIEAGTLHKGVNGGGFLGHSRHGAQMERIRRFSDREIYKAPSLRETREGYRAIITQAMTALNQDLLLWDKCKGGEFLTRQSTEVRYLSTLPGAALGCRIPADMNQAVRWLLDEFTLLSDSQVLELSNKFAADNPAAPH